MCYYLNMINKFILVLFILLQGLCCFAYEKQADEYSCGAVSAYNLIDNICPVCANNDLKTIYRLLKTDANGTTTYNLCRGLDKYFSGEKIRHDILYYGIKSVKKYKVGQNIDLDNVQKLLASGYNAIINIGIYKKTTNGYIRQYGHYVNLVCADGEGLKVFDPYDKEKEYTYWSTKDIKVRLQNVNDNEKYANTQNHILITSPINYLEQDELAIINGIVLIKLL